MWYVQPESDCPWVAGSLKPLLYLQWNSFFAFFFYCPCIRVYQQNCNSELYCNCCASRNKIFFKANNARYQQYWHGKVYFAAAVTIWFSPVAFWHFEAHNSIIHSATYTQKILFRAPHCVKLWQQQKFSDWLIYILCKNEYMQCLTPIKYFVSSQIKISPFTQPNHFSDKNRSIYSVRRLPLSFSR